mmetsp:Transcript_6146/g.10051  ORF Transcript_6146/g.10051 Transcript_6146/m.10051 type:complete len:274 (+) Transcript_6146:74-895(+)
MTDFSTVPPFLKKTYEIISTPEFADICSWGSGNDTIFIKNIEEFADKVLPKYFKHSNYASFKRQLHKYDFHKTVHNPRHGEFKHPYFIKDQPELMTKIERKVYVSKNIIVPDTTGGITDGETDVSSDKDGSRSAHDKEWGDFDIDSDFLEDESEYYELDFEMFDSVEASVERGIIEFDNERITVLEKRQADLMEDNRVTAREIQETLKINSDMSRAMDVMLSATNAVMSKANNQGTIECPPCDQVEELCEVFTTKCALKALKEKELENLKSIL